MFAAVARNLETVWYTPGHPARWVLWPLEMLYRALHGLRELSFRFGLQRVEMLPVPVVVVGNITVGGTGKTPCVVWLANELVGRGLRVGCVSRGYGGSAATWPQVVDRDSDPLAVGDEPVLIARATSCPVVVGPDRVAAAKLLLDMNRLDVVLADDGLQHQRLGRRFEIVVVDGERGLGNGACLPAGPLRDPVVRLRSVDAVIVNGGSWGDSSVFRAKLTPQSVYQLTEPRQRSLGDFRDTVVHAVAGIGNPERFFALLEAAKIRIIPHAFTDHAPIQESDLAFEDEYPILMTEKDAVKCRAFASDRFWVVAVTLEFDSGAGERLIRRVLSDL